LAVLLTSSEKMLQDIRQRGYATQARNVYTATPGKTSSIAMPLFKDGHAIGALGMIFFASAVTMAEAEARFVPHIRETARAISEEMGSGPHYPPVDT
jgi:IclR family mhp operon transcriptional activator